MKRIDVVAQVLGCTACELHRSCLAPVPLRGDNGVRIAIVGEAPGETEDIEGKPFVGPAGRLLQTMLTDAGFDEPFGVLNTVSCLDRQTRVFLADGTTERIGKLVADRYEGEVLSVDDDGRLVARRVVGWHRTPLGNRSMYRVTHDLARRNMYGTTGLLATGDHQLLTRRGWVAVDEIKPGDQIHSGMSALSGPALQVTLSGLLGDATLNRRTLTQLEFCSGADEGQYLNAKWDVLRSIDGLTSRGRGWPRLGVVEKARGGRDGLRLRLTHPELRGLANCSPAELVEQLDDFGLACWFMDDGYLRTRPGRRPDAEISVARLEEEAVAQVVDALRRQGHGARASLTSMGWRIKFGVIETEALLARIGQFIVEGHKHKLNRPWVQTSWPTAPAKPLWANVHVEEVAYSGKSVYCLSVQEHQNFVTVGGVVHNCFPNGTPTWDHVRACDTNKWSQLEFLDPQIVLLLGKIALKAMRPELEIGRARGRPFLHRGRLMFATYHPSAALRNGDFEHRLREDLAIFRALTLDADNWVSFIPDRCATCSAAPVHHEDTGLTWCRAHLPSRFVAAYEARESLLAAELDAARARSGRQRDAGIAAVAAAADPDWMEEAWNTLVAYLRQHNELFVDDFWPALREPEEARALGPIMLKASRDGLMRKTGRFRKSVRSNMTEKPIWESLIYHP